MQFSVLCPHLSLQVLRCLLHFVGKSGITGHLPTSNACEDKLLGSGQYPHQMTKLCSCLFPSHILEANVYLMKIFFRSLTVPVVQIFLLCVCFYLFQRDLGCSVLCRVSNTVYKRNVEFRLCKPFLHRVLWDSMGDGLKNNHCILTFSWNDC